MPFKFRKSFKILPGVKINLSKSGISTSLGGKGHSVNIGKKGVKTTLGIPGTGISYTTSTPTSHPQTSHVASQSTTGNSTPPPAFQSQDTTPPPPGAKPPSKNTLIIIGVIVIAILVLCCCCPLALGAIYPTGTPTKVNIERLGTQVFQTKAAEITLSAPAPTITLTLASTETPLPLDTETSVPLDTETTAPSETPIIIEDTAIPQPTEEPTSSAACYSEYPDFCIPKQGARQTCKELGRYNFTVLAPDPLDYDGNNDGIGCNK